MLLQNNTKKMFLTINVYSEGRGFEDSLVEGHHQMVPLSLCYEVGAPHTTPGVTSHDGLQFLNHLPLVGEGDLLRGDYQGLVPGRKTHRQAQEGRSSPGDLSDDGEQPDAVRVRPGVAEPLHGEPGAVTEPRLWGEQAVTGPDTANDGVVSRGPCSSTSSPSRGLGSNGREKQTPEPLGGHVELNKWSYWSHGRGRAVSRKENSNKVFLKMKSLNKKKRKIEMHKVSIGF